MLPGTADVEPGAPGDSDGDGVGAPDADGVGVGVGVACSSDWRSTSWRAFVVFGVGRMVAPGWAAGVGEGAPAGAGTPLATASTWRNWRAAVSSSAASLVRDTP